MFFQKFFPDIPVNWFRTFSRSKISMTAWFTWTHRSQVARGYFNLQFPLGRIPAHGIRVSQWRLNSCIIASEWRRIICWGPVETKVSLGYLTHIFLDWVGRNGHIDIGAARCSNNILSLSIMFRYHNSNVRFWKSKVSCDRLVFATIKLYHQPTSKQSVQENSSSEVPLDQQSSTRFPLSSSLEVGTTAFQMVWWCQWCLFVHAGWVNTWSTPRNNATENSRRVVLVITKCFQ